MFIKVVTIANASSIVVFSPNATIFELLSFLVTCASFLVVTLAHLTPFTLLQAILIPIPEPHIATPKSTFLSLTFSPSLNA